MTLAAELEILANYIGTDTESRTWLAFQRVHNALSSLAETTATELTSTDNAFPRFNGTEGVLQNGQTTEDDSGNVTVAGNVGAVDVTGSGDVTGNTLTSTTSCSAATFVPDTVPEITGLTTDAALIQLLAALETIGLITDSHVEV